MIVRWDQVERDLRTILNAVPLRCLVHLRDNRRRWVRGVYRTGDGRGCLMNLLMETLPLEQHIDSPLALKLFFAAAETPAQDKVNDPHYQPARWIVRLWDGQICERLMERYGDVKQLSDERVLSVLHEVIAERESLEVEAAQARQRALERLAERALCYPPS